MSEPDTAPDDRFDQMLAAYHEALAAGASPTDEFSPTDVPHELADRLRKAEQVLRQLEADRLRSPTPGGADDLRFFAGGPDDAPPGKRLGRFHVLKELGRGGHGIVFLAWDPRLRREVALKVPTPEALLSPELRRRFVREAQAAAGLDQPGIVQVYEVGEVGPVWYIASRYCSGGTLAARLREHGGPLPARAAARLVAILADAVAYTHSRGILHRDLKPGNVLLDGPTGDAVEGDEDGWPRAWGAPRVGDFGLARPLEGGGDRTRTGALVGTPDYMAPEQAGGRTGDVGVATDVWALGVILYECLTGRRPFRGESDHETLQRVLTDPPARLRDRSVRVPRDLEAVCLKCLEKEPKGRYASAAALAEDLRRFLEGRPTVARPLGLVARAGRWARRRPRTTAGLGLLAVALAALGLGGWRYLDDLRQFEESRSAAGRHRAEADERDRLYRTLHYANEVPETWKRWKAPPENVSQNAEDLRERLDRLRPEPGKADVRGFEWFYLWQRLAGLVRMPGPPQLFERVAFSPDGRTLATSSRGGGIHLWEAGSGSPPQSLQGVKGEHHITLQFSPDGRRLISASQTGTVCSIQVWDVATARPVAELTDLQCATYRFRVAVSPDGQTVAFGGLQDDKTNAQIHLWDLRSGSQRTIVRRKNVLPDAVSALCFAPGGNLLAVGVHDATTPFPVELFDLDREEVRFRLTGHSSPIYALAFSPDGATLASGSADQTVKVWDTATGRVKNTLQVEPLLEDVSCANVVAIAFSPDGRTLATGWTPMESEKVTYQHCRVSLWDVASGKRLPQELRPRHGIMALTYAPDGRTLAVGCWGEGVRLWDTKPIGEFVTLTGTQQREAWSVAFSPDGRTLAVGYDDGHGGGDRETLQLWDLRTGRARATLAGHGSMVYHAAFSPDGKSLASAGHDKTVRLWDAATGRLRATLEGHTHKVRCVAWSPDGGTVASGGSDPVRLWEVASGKLRHALVGHGSGVNRVAFAPDGKTVVAASYDGHARIYDAATGGEDIRWCTDTSAINAVAYAPDGQTLATGNKDGFVKLWDFATCKEKASLEAHKGEVWAVAYSPDGRTLASGGADRTVRLWQAATGRPLLTFDGLPNTVRDLAFSPNGRTLAAALHDGSVRLWLASEE